MSNVNCDPPGISGSFCATARVLVVTVLVALLAVAKAPGPKTVSGKSAVAPAMGDLTTSLKPMATGSTASVALSPVLFRKATYDSGGQLAWSVAVADLNGDGKPDMVAVNYQGNPNGDGWLGVLLGKGNGSFEPPVAYDPGGGGPMAVAIADLNNDGKLDLVVRNQGCRAIDSQCLSVLLGNGDGTFQPAVLYNVGGEPGADPGVIPPILIADLNGDNKLDLIVTSQLSSNNGDGAVGVLLGNGDGTFGPVVTYDSGGFGTSSAVVADVNGDGQLDLVVLNCASGQNSSCPPAGAGTVGILLGNGDGTLQAVKTYSRGGLGSFADPLVVADVNGDGKPDVLFGNACPPENGGCASDGSIGVLLGNGDGTFRDVVTYASGGDSALSLVVADLNGDGKLDLAVANGGAGVLLGNGDGTFQSAKTYGEGCCQVLMADVNADGIPDLAVVAGTSGTASVLLGNGDGTFEEDQTLNFGGGGFSHLEVADVNKDGRPDLLAVSWCGKPCRDNEGRVEVWLNFRPATTTALSTSGSPSDFGQPVTFTATVISKDGAIPNGELVKFFDGGKLLGSVAITSGTAAYTTSALSVATHTIKAEYVGDTFFHASSGRVVQIVSP